MSDVVRDVQSHPGYYLPEGAQYRLQQLRDHMRFLARLAQPRTQAEEQARQPAICMDELGFCLELLSEQLTALLAQLQWPAHLQQDLRAEACAGAEGPRCGGR
ncbi:XAC0095 family protein [Xanthomonas melonis]|uniref:XAC0095 family protein n=1 Tax=Xanthomonas melonis TaxID=56456 RepID=UPI003EB833B4